MKKIIVILIIMFSAAGFFITGLSALSGETEIDRIRLTDQDIPEGFRYGIIPDFAHGLLKENPWLLDNNAMKKLTHRIYPGAEYTRMSSVHMTILAKKENPYGDDIVCYIFKFRDGKSAKEELSKLNEYSGYNSDRSIVLEKNNMAVFLLVDSTKDYDHIMAISRNIQSRLDNL